jgi:hypothetical protein
MTAGRGCAGARVVLAAACLLLPVRGQTPTSVVFGPVSGGEFGTSVAALGDVDSDGVPDFVAGSPREDTPAGADVGRARVISGQTGAVLFTFDGDGADDTFGTAVANAGDVNADGVSDVMVGATEVFPVNTPGPGYVKVFSGASGTVVHQIFGTAPGSLFGATLGSTGDVDGDGRSDFFACSNSGTRVFSGLTGALMFVLAGSRADGGRDVTGDGVLDIVTATGSSGSFTIVRVYAGSTGALVRSQNVPAAFTPRVTLIDDLDFDGRADIIVSDIKSSLGAVNSGVVRILSGVDGATLFVIAGAQNEFLGWATADVGDFDGDGVSDWATATAFNVFLSGQLKVALMSGADGSVLQTFTEPGPFVGFGWSLDAADLTGDATPDLLVGVLGDSTNGFAAGSVYRYDSATPPYDLVYRNAGCGGAIPDPPVLKVVIQPSSGATTVSFGAGPPNGLTALVLAALLTPPVQVFPPGCRLSIDPFQPYEIVALVPLDPAGGASLAGTLPTGLGGSGITVHAQALVTGPGAAPALTQAASLTFN